MGGMGLGVGLLVGRGEMRTGRGRGLPYRACATTML